MLSLQIFCFNCCCHRVAKSQSQAMKLYGKELEKDGSGSISIETEDGEDLWHLYNLISVGVPAAFGATGENAAYVIIKKSNVSYSPAKLMREVLARMGVCRQQIVLFQGS